MLVHAPIAVDRKGNELVSFSPGPESELTRLDLDIPLPLSLVVARHAARTLLVLNRWRREWELPGGMLDAGESPREAAVREFLEETGQPQPELEFAGTALFRLMPEGRLEFAAIYTADVLATAPFEANEEIEQIRWWDGTALPGLSELDAMISRLV